MCTLSDIFQCVNRYVLNYTLINGILYFLLPTSVFFFPHLFRSFFISIFQNLSLLFYNFWQFGNNKSCQKYFFLAVTCPGKPYRRESLLQKVHFQYTVPFRIFLFLSVELFREAFHQMKRKCSVVWFCFKVFCFKMLCDYVLKEILWKRTDICIDFTTSS